MTDTVKIEGVKISARHGVLPQEKIIPQEFLIDAYFDYDVGAAVESDDVADAVNYAGVCEVIQSVCLEKSCNLIEKLAYETAFAVMDKFSKIKRISVTVHKPHAPVDAVFGDISVTVNLERNTVILSLGSSMGDKKAMLDGAVSALGNIRGISVSNVSDYITTKPYGGVAERDFLNCAVKMECLLPPRRLLQILHSIESNFGRVRSERWGDRTLDIDIVFFGGKIIEEEGLCVPHPDYANRAFVLLPVKQIAPDFVCPIAHKRIADIALPDENR